MNGNRTGYVPHVSQAMVDDAHAAGLEVILWTIDDPAAMEHLMDLSVDGIPDWLRELMAERGLKLPKRYRDPHGSLLS